MTTHNMGEKFSFKFLTWLRYGLARRRCLQFANSTLSPEISSAGEHKRNHSKRAVPKQCKTSKLLVGSKYRNTDKSEKTDL